MMFPRFWQRLSRGNERFALWLSFQSEPLCTFGGYNHSRCGSALVDNDELASWFQMEPLLESLDLP